MARPVADFHRLDERLRLAGRLTTRTALRIGSGGSELDAVDLPVLKDAAGFPFIPGASLKGVLRSTVEALIRGAPDAPDALWACDPLADQDDAPFTRQRCGYHERGDRAGVDVDAHCAVCRLFGSQVVASHVRFCDATLHLDDDQALDRVPVETRDGVSIDRDLRRAAGQRKFDFEVVSPGTSFTVEVFVENPKPWLLGLLVMAFDQLAEGFTALGGFTSRGLGRVEFSWSSITRVTASSLLRGDPATVVEGPEPVAAELAAWRDALGQTYRGDA